MISESDAVESQVTNQPGGHILTNTNVWSPDSRWLVYDTRSDPAGEKFDGSTIEIVNAETGEVREIYRSHSGAHCGAATFSPVDKRVVFILGPETPAPAWQYSACHRRGVMVEIDQPQIATPLDARDITSPFTPGALRGGSHVHVFDGNGEWISFTYEDHVLAALQTAGGSAECDINQRNVGVSVPGHGVTVPHGQMRNHDGSAFSVLITRTANFPRPGSDEISRACEEGWIGTNGYVRGDGSRQKRAIAFQGTALTAEGRAIVEVFVVDLPDDLTQPGDGPLQGTATTRPMPPRGVLQRRLSYTAQRKFPGLQGPRHWLRSSPDGSRIALLMRDDAGVVQIWTISPLGGKPELLTQNLFDVSSAFTWSPSGSCIAYVADNSIFTTDLESGATTRQTRKTDDATAPRPETCVFSPDGTRIAYVRHVPANGTTFNQIFVAAL
jgi:dipeptidyl aminopeptidase/acylaminoacyl peptidase